MVGKFNYGVAAVAISAAVAGTSVDAKAADSLSTFKASAPMTVVNACSYDSLGNAGGREVFHPADNTDLNCTTFYFGENASREQIKTQLGGVLEGKLLDGMTIASGGKAVVMKFADARFKDRNEKTLDYALTSTPVEVVSASTSVSVKNYGAMQTEVATNKEIECGPTSLSDYADFLPFKVLLGIADFIPSIVRGTARTITYPFVAGDETVMVNGEPVPMECYKEAWKGEAINMGIALGGVAFAKAKGIWIFNDKAAATTTNTGGGVI